MADTIIEPGTSTEQEKVVFDEAQTKRVNEIVVDRVKREQEKFSRQLEERSTQLQQLQQELAEAREAARTAKPADKAEANDEVARLRAELEQVKNIKAEADNKAKTYQQQLLAKEEEVSRARNEAVNIRKESAIRSAIGKIGFVDPDDVVLLTQQKIQWSPDHNKHVVVGDSGDVVLNSSYEPKSLDEFYREYAEKKKSYVRSDVLFGAGSSESKRAGLSANGQHKVDEIFGPKSNSKLANDLARSNYPEYKRLKGEAQKAGLI